MHAKAEPLASILRVFADGNDYGDPYEWVATIRYRTTTEIEITGNIKRPTPQIWKAIALWCKEQGITRVLVVRMEDGQRTERWITE